MEKVEFETDEINLLRNIFELAYKSSHLCWDENCANNCIAGKIFNLEDKVSRAIGIDIDADCWC